MPAAVVRRTDTAFIVTVEVPYKGSMLDAEEAIQQAVNEAGVAATEEALWRFAADGAGLRPWVDHWCHQLKHEAGAAAALIADLEARGAAPGPSGCRRRSSRR